MFIPPRNKALDIVASIPLMDDEVHVWSAILDLSRDETNVFFSLLSEDEKRRSERFYFERDRQRFVFGRGLLRILLGKYLSSPPQRIEFTYGRYGKPELKDGASNRMLRFNLSHSDDLVMFVFSWMRRVGIDVERIRSITDENRFAEQLFSSSEGALIRSLSGDEKVRAFFKLWTCKEAFYKASGDGLTAPIARAEISLGAGEAARLISVDGDSLQAERWRLQMFNPTADYQSCIAVEGFGWEMIFSSLALDDI